ncbi:MULTISPECIES: adenylate/guanylate cyclase domain-containing protein [unclassified Azospirillum]|uniref:ATP-binding protein n=1 Tax=unclassified Azospirillum TaxID=2630922 RepID=UPI00135ABA10|nr:MULTISPECIES: adenylate/guanylate cyclase domain-containing protein [unclassified Azospirillum]
MKVDNVSAAGLQFGFIAPGAQRADLGATEEADRRTATIFFCDIVNSTQLIAPSDPEDARDLLNGVMDVMVRHIQHYGGTVCQRLGDGVYAVFGAPAAQENHAVRACAAADAIVREIARGQTCAVRVGLCSGEIVWDGSALRHQNGSPAVGRAVHAAAKLQQASQPNRVRLADSTAALAADWVDMRAADLVSLTALDRIGTFELLGVRRRRLHRGQQLPMVGREVLRRTLSSALAALSNNPETPAAKPAPLMHIVSGEAGLGKSRLLSLLAAEARWRGVRVVEWSISAIEPVGAPQLLQELVGELLDCPAGGSAAESLAAILAAGVSHPLAEALAGLLHPVADISPAAATERLAMAARAVAELAIVAARRRPILLVVEDLQWVGSELLAVLCALLRRCRGEPILILGSNRAVRPPEILTEAGEVRGHVLSPLNAGDARALLDSYMGRDPALASIKDELQRRAQGNPFFLIECVRVLVDQEALAGPVGGMRLGTPTSRRLPDSVQALLAARTDRLAAAARDVLRAAAVIGPTFDIGLLSALTGCTVPSLPLAGLSDAGFIDETRLLPRLEYSFHHALMHEAVYEGITRRERQRLHGRVAELLEGEHFAQLPGRLAAQARHADNAKLWPVAVRAGRAAGKEALQRSLAAEAVSLFALAVRANDQLPMDGENARTGIDLRLILARAAMPAGDRDRALAELERAVELAHQTGDEDRALAGLVQQVSYEWVYGGLHHALSLADRALRLSGGGQPSSAHPEVQILAACCHIEAGNLEEAQKLLDLADRADAWQAHHPGRFMMVDCPMLIAIMRARCQLHQGLDASALMQQALQRADDGSYPFNRIYARVYAGEILQRQGRYPELLALCNEALSISAAAASPLLDNVLHARRGLALVELGRRIEGLAEIEQAEHSAAERGAILHASLARYCRILGLTRIGLLRDAEQERLQLEATVQRYGYGLLSRFLAEERQLLPCETGVVAEHTYIGPGD